MKSYELSFGKIVPLQKDLAEVIINNNIELDEENIKEFHDALHSYFNTPFSLLINKLNYYSYTFNALMALGSITELNMIGIVAYNNVSKISTEAIMGFLSEKVRHIKLFNNRTEALQWLMQE